jgi:hypothetical protein
MGVIKPSGMAIRSVAKYLKDHCVQADVMVIWPNGEWEVMDNDRVVVAGLQAHA